MTWDVGAFQLEMSVDQDLTVVAETIDDDVVSTGSETRFPCSHVHETNPCKQGFEKKGAAQTDAEKTWWTLETTLIVQQCAQQHALLNYVCMQTEPNEDCRTSTKNC